MNIPVIWNKITYKAFVLELKENIDLDYLKFNIRLINTKYEMLGIRTPLLKKIAKEISKNNPISFLEFVESYYYEEVMLELLVISNLQNLELINIYINKISKIDNWAICDTVCANMKIIRKNKDYYFKYIEKFLKSDQEYIVRFGIVLLLDYYVEKNYIDKIFILIDNINRNEYYVEMAIAWIISVMLVKYKEKTLIYLKHCNLNNFIYNKALQKAMESNRINIDDKLLFKTLKRKKVKKDA